MEYKEWPKQLRGVNSFRNKNWYFESQLSFLDFKIAHYFDILKKLHLSGIWNPTKTSKTSTGKMPAMFNTGEFCCSSIISTSVELNRFAYKTHAATQMSFTKANI